MIILAIIFGFLALGFGILWLSGAVEDNYGNRAFWPAVMFFTFGIVWFFVFLFCFHFSWSNENLTGYIYSSETKFGYTTGHIRFSEQAGQDVQPSFCVKADSVPGKQITELAGSGKKVRVTIPPYFYLSNNPFACGTDKMTIEVQE